MHKQTLWKTLQDAKARIEKRHLRDLFNEHPARFEDYSLHFGSVLLDYSKNHLDDAILTTLCDLAHASGLPDKVDALFFVR